MPLDMRATSIAAAMLALSAPALGAPAPTGVWMNDTGRGAIEIKDCGGKLCGHVVWVKDTSDTKGCGRQIIGDASPISGGMWDNGWIYSPEKKKRYDVELKPLADGTLRVKGYAGSKFFSKTMIWTQAPADLVRCGANQVTAAASAEPAPLGPAKVPAPAAPPLAPQPAPDNRAPVEAVPPAVKPEVQAPIKQELESGTPGESDKFEGTSSEGLDLGDLKLEKYFSRTAAGDCKLDLPWVKLNFRCED